MSGGGAGHLVMMANQIAAFFDSQPGDSAPLHVADHIMAFWEPTMRARLIAHNDAGGEGMVPSVRAAADILKTKSAKGVERALDAVGEPSPAHRPGSDAG